MSMRHAWILSALALVSIVAAQTPEMAPPPELKKLDWYLGQWEGKMKWTMPGMPATDEEMSVKNEWEGQFFKSTSVMNMSGQKMTEVSFTGWNSKTKKLDAYTFTNFAPTPRIEHGDLQDEKFVFESEPWEVGGMAMIGRSTVSKKSNAEIEFQLEFKLGDKWEKVAEGTMKRKKE